MKYIALALIILVTACSFPVEQLPEEVRSDHRFIDCLSNGINNCVSMFNGPSCSPIFYIKEYECVCFDACGIADCEYQYGYRCKQLKEFN